MRTTFDTLDQEFAEESRPTVRPTTVVAVVGGLAFVAAFLYDLFVQPTGEPLLGVELTRLDWLWYPSLWFTAVYGVSGVVRRPDSVLQMLRDLSTRPAGLLAGVFVSGVVILGVFGPLVVEPPTPDFRIANQPPVLTSVQADLVNSCRNLVAEQCHGTRAHPLGTNAAGEDILTVIAFGARVTVKLVFTSVMLIVPLGTAIGVLAAYLGGRTDRILTGVAETVKTVPALLVFLVWRWIAEDGTLFMLVAAFGVFGWGTVAAVVRSRAVDEVSKDYVASAELSGASKGEVIRWHLLPNVARSAVSTALYQVPLFVTIEATLSFLMAGTPPTPLLLVPYSFKSWGSMIGSNFAAFDPYWWRLIPPVAALFLTVLALSVFANAVQSVADPRSAE